MYDLLIKNLRVVRAEADRVDALDVAIKDGRFAALEWRNEKGLRALCLHGWLDNAASFIPLAPLLKPLDLVALDMAGHGHSQHRPTPWGKPHSRGQRAHLG